MEDNEIMEIERRTGQRIDLQRRAEKIEKYRGQNEFAKKGGTVLCGSSLMEHFPVNELLMADGDARVVYNRGVAGARTEDILKNLDACIFGLEPSKLFINIGSNDLDKEGDAVGSLLKKYAKLLRRVKERLPDCRVWLIAYYPVVDPDDERLNAGSEKRRTNEQVQEANARVRELAESAGCSFLDFNHLLEDSRGYLRSEYAADKVHIRPVAYRAIYSELKNYL